MTVNVRYSTPIGISDQTFYRWRLNCGALKEDEAQRLKALHRNHMRVRVHREADLGMTEHVHDHSGRNLIMDLEGVEFNEPNTLSKSARAIWVGIESIGSDDRLALQVPDVDVLFLEDLAER